MPVLLQQRQRNSSTHCNVGILERYALAINENLHSLVRKTCFSEHENSLHQGGRTVVTAV